MRFAPRKVLRGLLGTLYLIAACFHLATPAPFLRILPGWVPRPEAMVAATGVAEGIGALMLLQPWSARVRRAGGLGLALYAVCVFPANVRHFGLDMAKPDGGLGLAYHVPRMLLQPVLVWLALVVSNPTSKPLFSVRPPR